MGEGNIGKEGSAENINRISNFSELISTIIFKKPIWVNHLRKGPKNQNKM
jgi:hypothetical protein